MKNFDLRDLDAFVAVARTRNFRRAATEEGVSVSSLSQRLRDIADDAILGEFRGKEGDIVAGLAQQARDLDRIMQGMGRKDMHWW